MLHRSYRLLLLAAVALLAAACGQVDLNAAVATYREAKGCCATPDQLTYAKLPANADTLFAVAPTDPMVDFGPDGRSYCSAFELPPAQSDYLLVVRSYMFADRSLPPNWAFFFPVITLLDADKRPVASSDWHRATFRQSTLTDEPGRNHRLEVTFPIRVAGKARYLVVHAAAETIGEKQHFTTMVAGTVIPSGKIFVVTGGQTADEDVTGAPFTPPEGLRLRMVSLRLPGAAGGEQPSPCGDCRP